MAADALTHCVTSASADTILIMQDKHIRIIQGPFLPTQINLNPSMDK